MFSSKNVKGKLCEKGTLADHTLSITTIRLCFKKKCWNPDSFKN